MVSEDREEFDLPLSEPGQVRRGEILRLALGVARRRRARRIVARGVLAAGAAVLISLAVKPGTTPPVRGPVENRAAAEGVAAAADGKVTYLVTDPHILERLAAADGPGHWQWLSDDQLLLDLASDGRVAALAERDGKVVLLVLGGERSGLRTDN